MHPRASALAAVLIAAVLTLAACASDGGLDAVSDTDAPAAPSGAAPAATADVLGATETSESPTTTSVTTTTSADPDSASPDDVTTESGPASATTTTTTAAPVVPISNPTPPPPAPPESPSSPSPSGPGTTLAPPGPPTNPSPPPPGIPGIGDLVNANRVPITVTPADDLTDGQIVTVASTEWLANRSVFLVQCVGIPEAATSIDGCDLGRLTSTGSSNSGNWSTTMRVRRYVDLGDGQHDCAEEPCYIGAGSVFEQPLTVGTHLIAFDADAPALPRPLVTIDPATNLRHRQSVTLTGQGFLPNAYVSLSQCVIGTNHCWHGGVNGQTDGQGAVTFETTVSRYISDGVDLIDCLLDPCELRFSTTDLDPAPLPLTFDPTEPAPPRPGITATPSTNLGADNEITATLTGVESYWSLSLCATDQPFACVYKAAGEQPLGATAPVNVIVQVNRLLVLNGVNEPIDCAVEACELRLTATSYGGVAANVPLSFASGGSITLPELSVTPSTNLIHGQVVTVSTNPIGTNLGRFTIDQCLSDGSYNCETVAELFDEERANGAYWSATILSTTAQLKRQVPQWDHDTYTATLVDCVAVGCELRMHGNGRLLGTVPISFDPAAPLPPDPTLVVLPSIGLRDGQAVTLDLDHLDGWINIVQCPTDQPRGQFCRRIDAGDGNGEDQFGTSSVTGRVRRILSNYDGLDSVDCAISNARCSIFLFDRYERQVDSVPLAFDPAAPLYPAPSLTVTPTDDLVDGQTVEVTVDAIDFTFWVQQCAVGANPRCDTVAGAEQADGITTTEVPVFRLLEDGTDCATESCELRVRLDPNNSPYVSQVLRQPITFDPDAPFAPGPQVTLSATTGLRDGDTITVTGTGFRPGTVAPAFCADPLPAGRLVTSGAWNCLVTANGPSFVEVVDGTFEATVTVRETFTGNEPTNCRQVSCYIVLAQLRDISLPALISDRIEFAPLEALTTEQRAYERVAEVTETRVVEGAPVTGAKVQAPASPQAPPPPTTAPPANPAAAFSERRTTGY